MLDTLLDVADLALDLGSLLNLDVNLLIADSHIVPRTTQKGIDMYTRRFWR